MTRRRLTWTDRKASAAPAMPGYQEPSIHPAAYPDPEADAYENGDTSAWAEDPHPGPYTNPFHPALPGTDEPMGHPATDPAHYFPAGVSKQASRQLRAAMEVKAAKCIRIAQSMLGRRASVSAVEDQALDLMNLTERQIQAALRRLADDDGLSQDVGTESSSDLLAVENMTLTPERTSEEAMLAAMLADEEDGSEGPMSDEEVLSHMVAEEKAKMSARMASRRRAAQMPGNQNDPDHYNFRAEGVLASKKSDDDVEAEEMLENMAKDEAKKSASLRRQAKKSEDDSDVEAAEDEEAAPEAQKKAAHFQRLAAYWSRVAKKSDDDAPEGETADDEVEAGDDEVEATPKKAAVRRRATGLSAELQQTLAALLAEDANPEASNGDDVAADDFMMDDLGVEDPMMLDDSGLGDFGMDDGMDDMSALYGTSHYAKKSDESDESETAEEEEAPVKVGKKAAVRPQPRIASNGVRTLGAVSKVASSDVNDLSKLWESAPDVSKIFG